MNAPLALALPVFVLTLVAFTAVRLRVTDRDLAWLAGGMVPADPEVAEVYRRYLRRHRVHRFVGGWLGVLLAATYGVASAQGLYAGFGTAGPFSDMLLCGLAGVLAGAFSAESYRLSEPKGARTATLAGHPVLAFPGVVLSARVLAGLAALVAVLGLVLQHSGRAAASSVLGVTLVALGEVTRRAIGNRRRPALSAAAAEVDARMRGYASAAVARLELSAAALALGWALAGLADGLAEGREWLVGVQTVVSLTLLAVAIVELVRAKPRPRASFVALPVGEGVPA